MLYELEWKKYISIEGKQDMLTEREQAERREAVANAIANQRLEGLEPDAQTIADLNSMARGELTLADAHARLYARIAAGDLAQ